MVRIIAKTKVALSCYHNILRSVWGAVTATDDRNGGHAENLTLLLLPFEKRHMVRATLCLLVRFKKELGLQSCFVRLRRNN